MSDDLAQLAWPLERLGEAVDALSRRSGLAAASVETPRPPRYDPADAGSLERWMENAAGLLGVEAEPVDAPYHESESLIRGGGPAVLRIDGPQIRHLLLLRCGRGRASLLGPDLLVHQVRVEDLRRCLCRSLEDAVGPEIDRLLDDVGISGRRRVRARAALLRERLLGARVSGCWILRSPPGARFWRQVVQARMPGRMVAFLCAHIAQYLLMLGSWWLVGLGALEGRIDRQWLIAWALLLITQVPLQIAASWLQGLFAISIGGLLKLRLLYGALRLEPEEIRTEGAGQLLGRVVEAGAVEAMALSAGFSGVMAIVELLMAIGVLAVGPLGGLRIVLYLLWVGVTALLALRYYRHRRGWSDCRLTLTNDLVERMVGHRTRLAQEAPERWHDGEDQALEGYAEWSRRLDSAGLQFTVLVSRGWMALGLLGLMPVIVSDGRPAAIAVGLGGIMLASRALGTLSDSLAAMTGAAIAWRQVGPLYRASTRPEVVGSPALLTLVGGERAVPDGQPVIETSDLVFRYRGRPEPVLRGCTVRIAAGERVLLEGPSGGGKSTLAAVLSGLRAPSSGLVLLGGLDRQTLGSLNWRRQVAAAPQFHENHVFTGTLAFNLLMGRRWPPHAEDLAEAEQLCHELGLGELLQRMPAGMQQTVGETGWQLSHGERSRLFIARALLQRSELVILDESFAALDPENMHRALRCVLRRARTLVVIAHR